jgi:hypothetical protein
VSGKTQEEHDKPLRITGFRKEVLFRVFPNATLQAATSDVRLRKAIRPFKLIKAITVKVVQDREQRGLL